MTETLDHRKLAKTTDAPVSVSRLHAVLAVVTVLLAYIGLAIGVPGDDAASRSGEVGAHGIRQSEHLAARDDGRPVATVHRTNPKGAAPPAAPVLIETSVRPFGLLPFVPAIDRVRQDRLQALALRDTNQPRAPPALSV
ncbi:hypothetical protein HFC70_19280 [Agrobacterium sp. a22-2]|uniref:hypothetical protein n=1 Tax=Agrobacterium sp. a22-2 TaxID=2283840 RepID=UPI001445668D|nr:hypothetical protein [Agrobacterium sp. a22-2]NKN38495.1 hypothetical protein [Agrobacterium sp. a22-2]